MIGVFDSGMGGLSVVRALRVRAPLADIVYFGDIANMPYGTKDVQTLERLTIDAMRLLRREGATHLVSACNSISAAVVRPMLELFGVKESSIVEMVGPAALALAALKPRKVAVAATIATVASGIYQKHLEDLGLRVEMIASPDLAQAIEFGHSPASVRKAIREIVQRAVEQDCDLLMLGCTHYPLVYSCFEEVVQEMDVPLGVFDPADAVAEHVLSMYGAEGSRRLRCLISKDSAVFRARVHAYFPEAQIVLTVLDEKRRGIVSSSVFVGKIHSSLNLNPEAAV